jgi:endonuclease-3
LPEARPTRNRTGAVRSFGECGTGHRYPTLVGNSGQLGNAMSSTTVQLLKRQPPATRTVRKWAPRFREIARRLVAAFGVPTLGNFDDPVREIFFIALSARTTDAQYRKTDTALWNRFRNLQELAAARIEDVRPCIAGGGLANKRASQLIRTAATLIHRLGPDPAEALRRMAPTEAFSFLTALPGMGPKSALCVMMCSLATDVFPVDINVQRVAARLGAIPKGLKHYQAQQRLPGLVPAGHSEELHVGMVVLGRKVCLPRKPRCDSCPLKDLCPSAKRHSVTRQ